MLVCWKAEEEGYQQYSSAPSHRGSCNQQWQRSKMSSPIYEYAQGWAVGAQLVLAVVKIDGSLDADGRVYGRHQGGRHLRAQSYRDEALSPLCKFRSRQGRPAQPLCCLWLPGPSDRSADERCTAECKASLPDHRPHTTRQKLISWAKYLDDRGVPAVQVCSKATDVQAHSSPYCYDGLLAPAEEHS